MRTTLTLDDDVVARLEEERKKRRTSLKTVVNDVIRAGLDALQARPPRRGRFRTTGFNLGPSLVGSLDNIGSIRA